jgi:hypothetical protein
VIRDFFQNYFRASLAHVNYFQQHGRPEHLDGLELIVGAGGITAELLRDRASSYRRSTSALRASDG